MTGQSRVILFSIILPTYNRAYSIERAIKSVFEQHEQSWELIIVDDGSTDTTCDIVRPLAIRSDRIRLVVQSNQGVGAARQIGTLLARGDFVTFLDSDDEYLPEHLAIRRRYIERYPSCDFFFGGVLVEGFAYVPDRHNPSRLIPLEQCAIGGSFVIRATIARQLGFHPLRYGDDADFFDRACHAGISMHRVQEATYRYNRFSHDSLCLQHAYAHKSSLE